MTTTKKQWTRDEVEEKIMTDDRWLSRGLLSLYNYQTKDEKRDKDTKYRNHVGFRANDAKRLSSFATFFITKGFFTKKQKAYLRGKLILPYINQLTKIANGVI